MPIEILELVFSANVVENKGSGQNQSATLNAPSATSNIDKQVLIEECVEQVMILLEQKETR